MTPAEAGLIRSPRTCDLHTHSTWSDGVESATRVVEHALDKGLAALALTDHDTLKGIPEARARAESTDLEIISGVELSTSDGHHEIHILGYFFDENASEIVESLEKFRAIRRDRAREMIERLGELGMPLDEDDVFARAKGETVGRPHIAEALVDAGFANNLDDAFRRFIGNHGPAWIPKPLFRPEEAIELISRAGGVTSVAHPATIGDESILRKLAKSGLTGLECIHPKHDATLEDHYRRLAGELELIVTGGSDCHGRRVSGSMIGYGDVPASVVDALREAAETVRGRS